MELSMDHNQLNDNSSSKQNQPENNNSMIELLENHDKNLINKALATQFPDWDLLPPNSFVKRRRTKLL